MAFRNEKNVHKNIAIITILINNVDDLPYCFLQVQYKKEISGKRYLRMSSNSLQQNDFQLPYDC